MSKTKTAEDYQAELDVAKARLTSLEEHDTSVQSQQLDDVLEWIDLNRVNLTPTQADVLIDTVNAMRTESYTEWHTKPEA